MYIDQTDIEGKIDATLLSRITGDDADKLATAINFAQSTIYGKLADRYQITAELALTGDNRNGVILEYALNLAIYRIYELIQDLDVPERVVKNYDDTQESLDKLNTGKTSLAGLTKALDSSGNKKSRFNWGSSTKRDNSAY
jgi:hypothetical protein